ncbi:hypothetical protein N7488_001009 [Penicillium malachiteum]|nr:hypothetical protein N7488_001009 [Penicillium malachiteum]
MAGPTTRQSLIKIQIFIKRKPDMTPEEFHDHWSGDHTNFALEIPGFKHVVKRYKQYHLLLEYQEKMGMMGLPLLDFDGVAELYVESVEKYVTHMKQEALTQSLREEAQKYMGPGSQVLIGYETLIHGEPTPGLDI